MKSHLPNRALSLLAVMAALSVALATSAPPTKPYPLSLDARVHFEAGQESLALTVLTAPDFPTTLTLEFADGSIVANPVRRPDPDPYGTNGSMPTELSEAGARPPVPDAGSIATAPLPIVELEGSPLGIDCNIFDCGSVDIVLLVASRGEPWDSTLQVEFVGIGRDTPPERTEIRVVER